MLLPPRHPAPTLASLSFLSRVVLSSLSLPPSPAPSAPSLLCFHPTPRSVQTRNPDTPVGTAGPSPPGVSAGGVSRPQRGVGRRRCAPWSSEVTGGFLVLTGVGGPEPPVLRLAPPPASSWPWGRPQHTPSWVASAGDGRTGGAGAAGCVRGSEAWRASAGCRDRVPASRPAPEAPGVRSDLRVGGFWGQVGPDFG